MMHEGTLEWESEEISIKTTMTKTSYSHACFLDQVSRMCWLWMNGIWATKSSAPCYENREHAKIKQTLHSTQKLGFSPGFLSVITQLLTMSSIDLRVVGRESETVYGWLYNPERKGIEDKELEVKESIFSLKSAFFWCLACSGILARGRETSELANLKTRINGSKSAIFLP